MSRSKSDPLDSKAKAVLCINCGGWPAPIRPQYGVAYCTECSGKKKYTQLMLDFEGN